MSSSRENTHEIVEFILKAVSARGSISDSALRNVLSDRFGVSDVRRTEIIDLIYRSGLIAITPLGEADQSYTMISKSDSSKSFTNAEEAKLYSDIVRAGAKGVSKLELKTRFKMNLKLVTKLLKNLEKDGHVRAYQTKDKNKVVYLHPDILPEETVVGGNLYVSGEVDQRLLTQLRQKLVFIVQERKQVSYIDLLAYLKSLPEGRQLDEREAGLVVDSLILDKILQKDGALCTLRRQNQIFNGIEGSIPCFGCPLFQACRISHAVSPITCVYYNEW